MDNNKRPDKIIDPDGAEYELVYDAEPNPMTASFKASVEKAVAISFAKGLPVARMDPDGRLYWLYADGHKEYI